MRIPGKEDMSSLLKPRTLIMIGILLLVVSMGILVDRWKTPRNGVSLGDGKEFFSQGQDNITCQQGNKCIVQYLHDDYLNIGVENEIE